MREKMALEGLQEILGSFKVSNTPPPPAKRACVTIWLTPEDKERYDRLQELTKGTGRRFSDVLRDTTLAVIDFAEARAS